MERAHEITGIGGIYAVLVEASNRPRYAFLVLQLVAEAADGRGNEVGEAGHVGSRLGNAAIAAGLEEQNTPKSRMTQQEAPLSCHSVMM